MTRLTEAKLIGVAGLKNAGKDTLATLIQSRRPRELRRYAMARPLKEGVKAMFGWTDEDIEDRHIKEAVDPDWGFSPREAMQLLGTEYGRNMLRTDIWIHAMRQFHQKSIEMGRGTIITDVRFDNEAEAIRKMPNSVIIHVQSTDVKPSNDAHESELGVQFMKDDDLLIENDKSEGILGLTQRMNAIW